MISSDVANDLIRCKTIIIRLKQIIIYIPGFGMSMLTDSSVVERDARPSEVVPPSLFQNRIYFGAAIMTSSRKGRSI